MKALIALAGTALSATLLTATPSQAQFFDPLFAAPAVAAGVATGVVAGAVGAATGVYPGYGYGYGTPTYGTGYYGPAYGTAPAYGYTDDGYQPAPTYTGRSTYRSYRQYRRSMDNPYN